MIIMGQDEFPTMFVGDIAGFIGGAVAGEYLENALAVEAEQMGIGRVVSLLVGIPVTMIGIMGMMKTSGPLNNVSEIGAAIGAGIMANGIADLVNYGYSPAAAVVQQVPQPQTAVIPPKGVVPSYSLVEQARPYSQISIRT